jgi:two-component system nitrate/nitrite sensor histidine kinase NarX
MNLLSPAAIGTVGEPAASPSGILADIAAGLASGSDLHDLLARFLRPIVDIAGAAAGAVRASDEDGQGMRLIASLGLPDEVLAAERDITAACGVCGVAAAGEFPRWAGDRSSCARQGAATTAGTGYRRVLAVPLRHRSRTLGVYTLFYDTVAEPSADVQALLAAAGDLLGMALDHARLERENLRAVVADERRAMAADVHDSIGQSLAYVKMRLPLLHDALHLAMQGGDAATVERYFEDVRGAVRDAHAALRGILTHLRSPMDPLGLDHALQGCADSFRRQGGPELEIVNDQPGLQLAPEQEAQVFHIVQEALSNVGRHAAARHARVHISRPAAATVQVLVEDDGGGLPAPQGLPADAIAGSHYGMDIMLDRARRLGGTLDVGPRSGGGTRVRLAFPLRGPLSEGLRR